MYVRIENDKKCQEEISEKECLSIANLIVIAQCLWPDSLVESVTAD